MEGEVYEYGLLHSSDGHGQWLRSIIRRGKTLGFVRHGRDFLRVTKIKFPFQRIIQLPPRSGYIYHPIQEKAETCSKPSTPTLPIQPRLMIRKKHKIFSSSTGPSN